MADPTRELAFDILCQVIEHRRTLDNVLNQSTGLDSRDRASAHRLAATVLRYFGSMTELLQPLLRREPPAKVKCALLMGVAQLRLLETPPHAAVNTVVELLRSRGLAPFAGLANAVLRKVARGGDTLSEGLDIERLDVPPWLWSSWGARARDIAKGLHREAPLDLTLAPGADAPSGGLLLPNGSIRFPAGTRVAELEGFSSGSFWVQDAAASIPVTLLDLRPDMDIVEIGAAPGGKTAQLAAAGARVTAVELHAERATRLMENLERLKLDVNVVIADAREWRPERLADVVVLDAPCSATGTFRRHPDVLWVKRPRDVVALTQGQDELIDAAYAMLKPGGSLLYIVCSLQKAEREERALAARERGWEIVPFNKEALHFLPEAFTREGYFNTHPGMWNEQGGMDGFFAVHLRKLVVT